MERRQNQSQKSKGKAAHAARDKEARLAATMAQQSVIAAKAAKDEAAQTAIVAEAAKDEEARDKATPANIDRKTTPAHQPINRRALVEQLNAIKQLKGQGQESVRSSQPDQRCEGLQRSAWLDGEVWLSDTAVPAPGRGGRKDWSEAVGRNARLGRGGS